MIEQAIVAAVATAIEPVVTELRRLRAQLEERTVHEWIDTAAAAKLLRIARRTLDARRRRAGQELELEGIVRREGARWLWRADRLEELR